MSSNEKITIKIKSRDKAAENKAVKAPAGNFEQGEAASAEEDLFPEEALPAGSRLRDIYNRPHRSPLLHWLALVLSLASLALLVWWLVAPPERVPAAWLWADVALSIFFVGEFVTRSGFQWDRGGYSRTHFFDFLAMVPVLVLAYFQVPFAIIGIWLVLIMRIIRVVDRLLGDGFIQRNFFALIDGIEEEISDRVILRTMSRLQADLSRGKFGHELAAALERHKGPILERIRKEHPKEGIAVSVARLTGLDKRLERAEEQIFLSIIEFLRSSELDKAAHEAIESTFAAIQEEVKMKSWKQNLGFRNNKNRRGPHQY